MANSVWKGHLTFGLVSIPVKLYRAARPEKLSFRQIHEPTGNSRPAGTLSRGGQRIFSPGRSLEATTAPDS